FFYQSSLNRLTFSFPPENTSDRYVAGTELTAPARAVLEQTPSKTIADLVADFGGIPERELVWTRDSINHAKALLVVNNSLLVLSIAGSVFVLAEGLLT